MKEKNEGSDHIVRSLVAEVVGTFVLTFVDAGSTVIAAISGNKVSPEAGSIAAGLTVMAMIYSIGHISGAHINPSVSLAFFLRRVFPLHRLLLYWAAQLAGAILAAFVLLAIFGPVEHLGATRPHFGIPACLAMETILTFFLVSVILSTATRIKIMGPNSALPVGGTVALCGLFAKPVSGASMNPARSFGPALVSGSLDSVWIYIVGPMLGASLAVLLVYILMGRESNSEVEAAEGSEENDKK